MNRRFPSILFLAAAATSRATEPGAVFLTVNPSVRSESMADSSIGIQGAEAWGLNPACGAPPLQQQVFTSFSRFNDQSSSGAVGWSRRVGGNRSALGVVVSHLRSDAGQGYSDTGSPTAPLPPSQDTSLLAGVSFPAGSAFRWGVDARAFRSELAGVRSHAGWAADAGIQFCRRQFTAHASVNNLGPGQTFLNQRDPLPGSLRLDAGWSFSSYELCAGLRRDLPRQTNEAIAALEYRWGPLALRAGYRHPFTEKKEASSSDATPVEKTIDRLSGGFGLSLKSHLDVDYAITQKSMESGIFHRLSLAWSWGDRRPPSSTTSPASPLPRASSLPPKSSIKAPNVSPSPKNKTAHDEELWVTVQGLN